MLDIQREKFEIRERLKAEGLSDQEIKEKLTSNLKPFKPAFIDGKRVEEAPAPPVEPKPKGRRKRITN